jgi:hypothetical protein
MTPRYTRYREGAGSARGPRDSGIPPVEQERLWSAWRRVGGWQELASENLGDWLGSRLLVLWALSTFSGRGAGDALLDELVDDDLEPRFGDELLEDMVSLAFALGASWAEQTLAVPEPTRPALVRASPIPLRVVSGSASPKGNRSGRVAICRPNQSNERGLTLTKGGTDCQEP